MGFLASGYNCALTGIRGLVHVSLVARISVETLESLLEVGSCCHRSHIRPKRGIVPGSQPPIVMFHQADKLKDQPMCRGDRSVGV